MSYKPSPSVAIEALSAAKHIYLGAKGAKQNRYVQIYLNMTTIEMAFQNISHCQKYLETLTSSNII